MGEPELRRRRLRPPSAAAAEAAAAAKAAEAADTAQTATTAEAPATEQAAVPDATVTETMAVEDPGEVPSPRPRPRLPRAPTSGGGYVDERDVERGLRGLVGSGSSQVSVGAALRARDAARPTEAHLAEAERSLAIVRRNWSPPRETWADRS
jgi:hypothetical protein